MDTQLLTGIILTVGPLVLSLTLHEFAHALTAVKFGDPTPKILGRCTLNPMAHIDPLGTLMLLLAGFGWAKPVPFNPNNLTPQRLGTMAVSAAGPMSNFCTALLCIGGLRLMDLLGVAPNYPGAITGADLGAFVLAICVITNLNLMVFNLIPLFPLDGHHLGRETLPAYLRQSYMQWQTQYGRFLLFGLMLIPTLLSKMTEGEVFDPLGWYLGNAVYPAMRSLLGTDAWLLAISSLAKCGHLLLWL